jgi:hypothetical protein
MYSNQAQGVAFTPRAISESCFNELMDPNTAAIERAFQLAKTGHCASVHDIMRTLKSEGYAVDRLVGSSLIKQLSAMISASRR